MEQASAEIAEMNSHPRRALEIAEATASAEGAEIAEVKTSAEGAEDLSPIFLHFCISLRWSSNTPVV